MSLADECGQSEHLVRTDYHRVATHERLPSGHSPPSAPNNLLKNAIVAFFNLAKLAAKLLAARKITTYVAIL
jgi:hypothetical protein